MKTRSRRNLLAICLITSVCMAPPVCALDTDGDGFDDAFDNCREVFNRLQLDGDGDMFGNRCDVDFNQDGFADHSDLRHFAVALKNKDPAADINEDGVVNVSDRLASENLWRKQVGPGAEIADDDGDGVPLVLST